MRSLCTRVLVALSILIVPTFAFASVTVNGTTTFAALDGGPDDADHTVNGVFTVNGDLTVNGTINCNDASSGAGSSACPMQFLVTGNLTLSAGSGVFAENRASDGNGANISFTVGGDVVIQGTTLSTPGAIVSSSKLNGGNNAHAGDITINAGGSVVQGGGAILAATAIDSNAGAISITAGTTATIGGQILSGCSRTLTPSTFYTTTIMGGGGGGHYVGGPITIRASGHSEPALVVTSSAIIASQGSETLPVTGNPVVLEACGIQIDGLVASLAGQGTGPGVIVRSGTTLTIDSSNIGDPNGAHRACIRSDAWHEDAGAMYVTLEAAKAITVTGPPTSSTNFSVTSNPGTTDKRAAGTITVVSTGGTLTATGNAFQVSGSHNGDRGGTVNISTKNDVTLSGAAIDASGATSDSNRAGGHINVRSYSGALNWTSGVGDVRPVGSTAGVPVGQQGTISLTYCTTLSTSGTSFPTNGSPVGVFPTTAQSCSPAAPSLPNGDTLPVCNTPPTANNTSATTNEDNSVTVTMTASDPDGDSLTFTIVTPPAHGTLNAIFNPTPTSAQVTYSPNANYNGSDSFTFKADDGKGGTSIGTVNITINPVNDPPTFNLGANPVTSNEDAGPQSIANYASSISPGPTADESSQTVTFSVTNDNNALFSVQPAISPSGTLTYTSAPNANGSANVMVVAHDSGGIANGGNDTSTTHNFNIVVNPVNDAPSFTPGSNVTVLDTDGAYSAAWATSISAGPPDESGQTLNFIVNNDNNGLFSAQPAISPSGVLTFTPIAGQSGVANVTVQLHDNGGIANGGVDTSAPVTFTITVDKVPVITSANNTTFVVGTFGTFTVTASAHPPADIFESGALPGGVNFVNNAPPSSSSGTLSGTPAAGTGGIYNITFTATNVRGSSAPQAFTLTVNEAPTVGTNPSDQTVCAGTTATFTASAATGFPAPTVQWQVSTDGGTSFSNIAGATSTTYSFTATVADNGHKYRAVFTNGSGSATTTAATLTVNTPPVVTASPSSQTVCAGANATFTASATSTPAATVQWQVSTDGGTTFNDISGATSTTYSFATVAADNGKQYRAVFTNACGSTNTSAATLTVDTLPVVTVNPLSQTVCAGAAVSFTASATSNANDHTVQWQVSTDGGVTFANIPGATSTTLAFATVAADNGKQYRAVFTDACGSTSSTAAVLTVDTLPVVTVQPSDTTVCEGATASFTSTATSNANDHTVQWQVSADSGATWNDILGATSTTLSFSTTAADNGKQYRAVFTDACGSSTSNAATLTVNTAPAVTGNPANTTVCENTIASFTASASGSPAPSVQWQLSIDGGTTWNDVAGATSTTYSFTATAGQNGNQYRAVFTNTCGSATTTAATLTVDTQPVVTVNPSDTSVQAGTTASFTAAASGSPAPAVQWQVSTDGGTTFNDIPGATSTTYSFTAQLSDNGKKYRAVFTNTCGSATTTAATLTVTCVPLTVKHQGPPNFVGGLYGTAYPLGQRVVASGGSGSYTFAVTAGALPTGLSLNSSTGDVTGTPADTGKFTFTITATDTTNGCTGSASFSISVGASPGSHTYNNLVNNTEAVVTGGSTASPSTPFVALTGTLLDGAQPSGSVAITPGTSSTNQGGSVTIAADGTFKYTPPLTASPLTTDGFNYALTSDSGGTGTPITTLASATLNLSGRVWYVNNSGSNGTGQSQSPFNSTVSFASASRVAPDASGDIIYIHTGDGTTTNYNSGVVLFANEQLIGNGVALVVNGNTLNAAGTNPQITSITTDAVTLANGNTLKGLTVTGAAGNDITGTNTAGLTMDAMTVQNAPPSASGLVLTAPTGTVTITNSTLANSPFDLTINGGTANVSINNTNTITANAGQRSINFNNFGAAAVVNVGAAITDNGLGISLLNSAAGAQVSFTGTQTLATTTNQAVTLTNNNGATISFSGVLGITTTTGTGFNASGGGTLNVTGTANVTTGAAANGVRINGMTIGGSGVTFTNVTTNGATTAINLGSFTAAGTVTVNGGTITNGTTGVSLQGTNTSLTLAGVTITGPTTGITNTTNFGTLTIGSSVNVSAAIALNLTSGTVSGTFNNVSSTGDTNGVNLNAVTGTWGTTGGSLTGATGSTFNVTGGSGGTISWGGTINQANGALAVSIAGSNTNTINFTGNVTTSGTSTGISIGGSSGTYNFTGAASTIAGTGGIAIAGESGSISFGSGYNISAATTSFKLSGTSTANITYSGAITNNNNGGLILDINNSTAGTYSVGTINFNGTSLSGNTAGITGVTSVIKNMTGTLAVNNLSLTSSNNNFANTLLGISGTNTGGSFTFNHLALSAGGIAHTGKGLVMSGGGSLAVTATGGASSIDVGSTALDLNGVTLNTSAIGTLNSAGPGTAVSGVSLVNVTGGGTLTVVGGALTGTAGATTFNVNGGSPQVSFGGTISQANGSPAVGITSISSAAASLSFTNTITKSGTAANAISITSNSNGSYSFSGAVTASTSTANAINLTSNTGATINFSGNLGLTTTTGTAFNATGGGTVTATGASSTVSATGGIGVNIANTTIGAANVTFFSVNANGGSAGISIDTTGTSGSFAVTGNIASTTKDNSGGTIQNMTGTDGTSAGHGIYLNSTKNVSLRHMSIQSNQGDGIHGTTVNGATIQYCNVGTTAANGTTTAQLGNFHGEGDVQFVDLTTSALIDNNAFSNAFYNTLGVFNNNATSVNRVVITNNTFGTQNAANGNDACVLQATDGTFNATFSNNTVTWANGDQFQFDIHGGVSSDLIMAGNQLNNTAGANIISGGGGVILGSGGSNDHVTFTFNVNNNTVTGAAGADLAVSTGSTGVAGKFQNYNGSITNNTFGNPAVTDSGSTQGSDVALIDSGSIFNLTFTGNHLSQYNPSANGALAVTVGDDTGNVANFVATITGNVVSNPGSSAVNVIQGMAFNVGPSAADISKACLTLFGNTLTGSGKNGGVELRIRQRASTHIGLLGNGSNYSGAANDTTAVVNFETSQNTVTNSAAVSAATNAPGGYQGTCP